MDGIEGIQGGEDRLEYELTVSNTLKKGGED